MTCSFKTREFELEYIESGTDHSLLWENHCHPRFEMIAVLEGDVSVMIEGRNYRLTENQTIIVPPLCYHSITVNKSGTYRRITALFDDDAIPEALRSEFPEKDTDVAICYFADVERLKEVCQQGDTSFFAPLAHSLLIQIFYGTLSARKLHTEAETDEFLEKVISYIDEHLQEKILLDDLAKYASRSKSSFCHLFTDKMNTSPKQYILQKKIALASKLIGEGTAPTVAAMQVGYDNYSNFYRIYLKYYGASPTKED